MTDLHLAHTCYTCREPGDYTCDVGTFDITFCRRHFVDHLVHMHKFAPSAAELAALHKDEIDQMETTAKITATITDDRGNQFYLPELEGDPTNPAFAGSPVPPPNLPAYVDHGRQDHHKDGALRALDLAMDRLSRLRLSIQNGEWPQ